MEKHYIIIIKEIYGIPLLCLVWPLLRANTESACLSEDLSKLARALGTVVDVQCCRTSIRLESISIMWSAAVARQISYRDKSHTCTEAGFNFTAIPMNMLASKLETGESFPGNYETLFL